MRRQHVFPRSSPEISGAERSPSRRPGPGVPPARKPRLSTRLLVPLVGTVAAIMAVYSAWSLAARENALKSEAERETSAYATSLGIALEYAFADRDLTDVEQITQRISREPKIYGVIVYGPDAVPLVAAAPVTTADALAAAVVRPVVRTGQLASFDRTLRGRTVFSVLRPIRGARGRIVGAFETVQPLSFLEREIERARWRLLITTLVLIAGLFLVMHGLVRRVITRPLDGFLEAVRALQHGELSHRVDPPPRSRELGALAAEFNAMAGRLQAARDELIHEGEERLALERRLRETEKLAAIGQLAAGLAHEIGTPLNVVAGRAEMLLRRETEPDRQRKLGIILQQIERISRIVRNLLGFARRREPHMEAHELGTIVGGVLELLEAELVRAGVRVVREGPHECWARVDSHLVHELVLNLVMNAIHALETVAGDRRVIVRLRPAGDEGFHLLEVEDNGPGMDEEVLSHLFEPFFTTKPGGVGTGLGLAVARAIVEEHGGTIEAINVAPPGDARDARPTGALFRIALPPAVELSHA